MDIKINTGYTSNDIAAEYGSKIYRKRPEQYLGASDCMGIQNQFFEVLDNAIDETAEYCARMKQDYGIDIDPVVNVLFLEDGTVKIEDSGRGFPCDYSEKYGDYAINILIEHGSAGGKQRGKSGYSHGSTSGVHGTGITATMANCEKFYITTRTTVGMDGKPGVYVLKYEEGQKVEELHKEGEVQTKTVIDKDGNSVQLYVTGTLIEFKYSSITMRKTYNETLLDYPYMYDDIQKRLTHSLMGQSYNITIRMKYFSRDEIDEITPQTLTPETHLGLNNPWKIHFSYTDTNVPRDADGDVMEGAHDASFDATIYLGIAPQTLQYYEGDPIRVTTIVNRLLTEESTSNTFLEHTLNSLSVKIVNRLKELGRIPSWEKIPEKYFTNNCRALIILGYGGAKFNAQTKRKMIETRYGPMFKQELEKALIANEDFLNSFTNAAMYRYSEMKELENLRSKAAAKLKKDEEERKQKEAINADLDDFRKGLKTADDIDKDKLLTVRASKQPKNQSIAVIVEGDSIASLLGTTEIVTIGGKQYNLQDQPMYIISLKGKVKNTRDKNAVNKTSYSKLVLAFKAKILEQGFAGIAIFTDGDVDGKHIRILVMNLIATFAPHYINTGRVWVVPAPYSKVNLLNPVEITDIDVGTMKYQPGPIVTYSQSEHNSLCEAGATPIKYYTGLSDSDIAPISLLIDRSKWIKIETPTQDELTLLNNILTTGHDIKKTYTSRVYTPNLSYAKLISKFQPLQIKQLGDVYNPKEYSDVPTKISFINEYE